MGKGTNFLGQLMFGQLISLLSKSKILKSSRENGGGRNVKRFDAWQHLVVMLYAVIKRFDSLREILGQSENPVAFQSFVFRIMRTA